MEKEIKYEILKKEDYYYIQKTEEHYDIKNKIGGLNTCAIFRGTRKECQEKLKEIKGGTHGRKNKRIRRRTSKNKS